MVMTNRSTYRFIHTQSSLRYCFTLRNELHIITAGARVRHQTVCRLSGVSGIANAGVVDMQTIGDNAAINIRFVPTAPAARSRPVMYGIALNR